MSTKDELEKQRSTFSAPKRALLIKRLSGNSGNSVPIVIPKRPGAEFALTTFSPQGSWFLGQLEPGTATNNIPIAMRLDLPLKDIFEYPAIASRAQAIPQDEGQREMIATTAKLFLKVLALSDEKVEA